MNGEIVQRNDAGVVCGLFSQRRKICQQDKRLVEFIGKFVCCIERALADVPIGCVVGIGLRLAAKAYPHAL